MRIALVTREFPPETAWGGIGSFYSHFASALKRHGHDVEVFCQGLQAVRSSEETPGILVHRVLPRCRIVGKQPGTDLADNSDLGEFAFSLAWELFQAFYSRHQVKPFDIVEGHEHLGVNAFINFVRPTNCRTVTRYHTSYRTLTIRRLVDWPLSALIDRLEQQSILYADCRVATSRFINQTTQEDFSLDEKNTPIIPNLVTPPVSVQNINEPVEKENLVLFVGRLIPDHKRPDLAAQAFARVATRFPDWRIEFAGRDMPYKDGITMWDYCEALLRHLGEHRFHYHRELTPTAVQSLYQRARIILIPSQFESFGMVAIEAMHQGCVPIVTDQTALPDIVVDRELICRNGDLEDLTARLGALMGDAALWEAKSRGCREQVGYAFAAESVLQQNVDLFSGLLRGAPGPLTHNPRKASGKQGPESSNLPRISIITPSYNQGNFIEETICSVVQQGYPNFEHIVVDGGSTDQTLSILKKYPHLHWVSETDLGQAHAINKGLLMATGDIVAYLNSDDVYRPGTLASVAAVFESEPQTQIVVGACDYIDDASRVIGHLTARVPGLREIIRYWGWDRWYCIPQQSTFWRRSLLAEIGLFNPRYHFVMDYEMWLRIAERYPFRVMEQTLAGFRLAGESKTLSRTHEMYLEEFAVSRRFWHHLRLWDRITTGLAARQHLSTKLIEMAEHIGLTTHRGVLPRQLLRLALRSAPWSCLRPRFILAVGSAATKFEHQKTLTTAYNKFHRSCLHVLSKLFLPKKASPLTREQLIQEIARRKPWYQRIEFPAYGVTTTDDEANVFDDAAWDNKIGDLTLKEAARLRPLPKCQAIAPHLPSVRGLDVLEIGCNCGFFSFKFAELGARTVTGLDVAPQWLDNANWCKQILGYENVTFVNSDFMIYAGHEAAPHHGGLLNDRDTNIPLPDNRFDLIFMSTVLDHLFFPLFTIYKMLRLARQWVIIDVPLLAPVEGDDSLIRLSYPQDFSHHGFVFTEKAMTGILHRYGIPHDDIRVHRYNNDCSVVYVINTSRMADALVGA